MKEEAARMKKILKIYRRKNLFTQQSNQNMSSILVTDISKGEQEFDNDDRLHHNQSQALVMIDQGEIFPELNRDNNRSQVQLKQAKMVEARDHGMRKYDSVGIIRK